MSLGELSHNTKIMKLRHIEDLYVYADSIGGYGFLDDALASLNITIMSEVIEGYFITLCNKPNRTNSDETRWKTAYEFISDVLAWVSKGSTTHETLAKALKRLQHIGTMYQQLHVQSSKRQEVLRSLPANVVEAMYSILDPNSVNNPFKREKTKWMVFVMFVVLLHQGLRRGELLLQTVNAVKTSYDTKQNRQRYWLNINNLDEGIIDPRASRPSIKTKPSIRQIPVSEFTANLIQTYTENYRSKANHPFLFNSARNTPLSMEGLSVLFKRISNAMSKEVMNELKDRTGKVTITPHDLRHTSAVVRLNQLITNGDEMDMALQKLRSFFGWSRTSDMPRKYAKAVFEDRLADIWTNVMDDRIAILRAIPEGK
jgi:integrase